MPFAAMMMGIPIDIPSGLVADEDVDPDTMARLESDPAGPSSHVHIRCTKEDG